MRLLVAITLFLIAVSAQPALAEKAGEDVWDRGCGDDDGNDRCDADVQKKMRESYGLQDMQTLAKQGVTLRRAMIVDGYGNDTISVSFLRKPGQSPSIEVRLPCASDKQCPSPLTANVGSQIWSQVLNQSDKFDQKLASELKDKENSEDKAIILCMHGWVVVVEAVDAAEIDLSGKPQENRKAIFRSDTESACAGGLAVPYAFQLADWAYDSLPECSGLNLKDFRNAPMLLATCARLGGDRLAAADAYELVGKLRNLDFDEKADAKELFSPESKARAADLVRELRGSRLYLDPPNAQDYEHATIEANVYFEGPSEGEEVYAPITFTLERIWDDFLIVDYTVGERKRVVYDDED
jgi:hypothetical protein